MQVSVLGENGLTEVRNVGNARISGIEADLLLRPMPGLTWSTGVAYNHAVLREDFCFDRRGSQLPERDDFFGGLDLLAEKGDRLPLTAPWKGSTPAPLRMESESDMKAHVQGVVTYEGKRKRDLRPASTTSIGNMTALRRGRRRRRRRKGALVGRPLREEPVRRARAAVEGHPVQRGGLRRSGRRDGNRRQDLYGG